MEDNLKIERICDHFLHSILTDIKDGKNGALVINRLNSAKLYYQITDGSDDVSDGEVAIALNRLYYEDFIKDNIDPITLSYSHTVLTNKGIAFASSDSFVNRAKKWSLEQKKLKLELDKIDFEVSKLVTTYNRSTIAYYLSIVTAVCGLLSIAGITPGKVAQWLLRFFY